MVDSISGSGFSPFVQNGNRTEASLSEEQKATIQDIISKYDPDNMDQGSMKAMMDELQAADIEPSREFGEIMNEAGFEPPQKPEGANGSAPPPPPGEPPQFITDFLQLQESGEATEDDITAFLEQLKENGLSQQGLLMDTSI